MEPFRLLLVDDQMTEILLVEAMLDGGPDQVDLVGVCSGDAALDYLDSSLVLPHLILLDLNLAGMCGLSVLRAVRASERLRDLPVVMRSGSQDPADWEAAVSAGASGYLVKPVLFDALEAQVQQLLADWQHLRRRSPQAGLATAG